jgi:hypothetical protein
MIIPEKYLFFPNGEKKAVLVHILRNGECPKKWERLPNHFTDKREVYKRI